MEKLKIPKNELENLYQLFKAGNIQLTIELCEGLNYDYVDLLEYVCKLSRGYISTNDWILRVNNLELYYYNKPLIYNLYVVNSVYCPYRKRMNEDINIIYKDIKTKNEALTLLYKYLKEQ